MSIAVIASSSHKSFTTNNLIPQFQKPKPKLLISCTHDNNESDSSTRRKNENQLAKLALVTLAAGVLTLGSVSDASAAKSGGRVGGQAFKSSAPPRSSSPRPRINNNSRTNIYVNPQIAPPLVGGYGYGYYGGGWGWSPFSFFAPGPSVAIGIGGGFETLALFLFLGAAAAVLKRFTGGSRNDFDDDDF
ncbi:FLUCTUATING-LIGHT-ACCLIMATION protein 1, chloroplastic [Euphorbia lathyris]|uniref:FLUCTUATING-LIGHT-ACCLIMATION protein 1, chloroplastic n=1 Tax=Euphorbia lathyris TaxID=212925 RepID=UPI0033140B14